MTKAKSLTEGESNVKILKSDTMTENDKSRFHAKARLSSNGRIVIPAEMRKELGLRAGESVFLDVEDGALRVESYSARIRRIQNEFAEYIQPGRLLSDELIAERREEARREMEEFERDMHNEPIRKAGEAWQR
jgi:AbrB family looped-hinge helix DNA binding protein